jgi:hypothetical protein
LKSISNGTVVFGNINMKFKGFQKRISQEKVTVDDIHMQIETHVEENDEEQTLRQLNAGVPEDVSRSSSRS